MLQSKKIANAGAAWRALPMDERKKYQDRSVDEFRVQRTHAMTRGVLCVPRAPSHNHPIEGPDEFTPGAGRYKSPEADQLGINVHGYVLGDLLGQGGFGNVFKATHKASQQWFAIKVFHCRGDDDDDYKQELKVYEILPACPMAPFQRLVYKINDGGGTFRALVLPLERGSLRDHLRETKHGMPASSVMAVTLQCTEGLQYLHKKGIVHLDFTSKNVLWNEARMKAIITDFGMSEHTSPAQPRYNTYCASYARAPELWVKPIHGTVLVPACDMWALGCLVYEAAAGRHLMRATFGMPEAAIFRYIQTWCSARAGANGKQDQDLRPRHNRATCMSSHMQHTVHSSATSIGRGCGTSW
jgi:serine/threonine protein kinase